MAGGGGVVCSAPGEESDAIRLYEFASGKLVALLKGHADVVYGLAFSPDGSRLISGSGDNTAILWDTGSLSGAGTGYGRAAGRSRSCCTGSKGIRTSSLPLASAPMADAR